MLASAWPILSFLREVSQEEHVHLWLSRHKVWTLPKEKSWLFVLLRKHSADVVPGVVWLVTYSAVLRDFFHCSCFCSSWRSVHNTVPFIFQVSPPERMGPWLPWGSRARQWATTIWSGWSAWYGARRPNRGTVLQDEQCSFLGFLKARDCACHNRARVVKRDFVSRFFCTWHLGPCWQPECLLSPCSALEIIVSLAVVRWRDARIFFFLV